MGKKRLRKRRKGLRKAKIGKIMKIAVFEKESKTKKREGH
jgi:hypothetical protein